MICLISYDTISLYGASYNNANRSNGEGGSSNSAGSSSASDATSDETSENKMKKALQDITALYYNEERNEIYAGNADGKLMVWSN